MPPLATLFAGLCLILCGPHIEHSLSPSYATFCSPVTHAAAQPAPTQADICVHTSSHTARGPPHFRAQQATLHLLGDGEEKAWAGGYLGGIISDKGYVFGVI